MLKILSLTRLELVLTSLCCPLNSEVYLRWWSTGNIDEGYRSPLLNFTGVVALVHPVGAGTPNSRGRGFDRGFGSRSIGYVNWEDFLDLSLIGAVGLSRDSDNVVR